MNKVFIFAGVQVNETILIHAITVLYLWLGNYVPQQTIVPIHYLEKKNQHSKIYC